MPEHPTTKRKFRSELIFIVVLIIIGLGLVLFFGGRAYRDYRRLQQRGLTPGTTDVEAIRGWMTLPYIANAYDMPEAILFQKLGVPRAGNENLSIKQLAQKYGREPLEVRQAIQEAILNHQRFETPEGSGKP